MERTKCDFCNKRLAKYNLQSGYVVYGITKNGYTNEPIEDFEVEDFEVDDCVNENYCEQCYENR